MIDFEPIAKPNLPSKNVTHIVANFQYPQYIKELEKCGINVIPTDRCAEVMPALKYHADMLFGYLGKGEFLAEKSQDKLTHKLKSLDFSLADKNIILSDGYPNDVTLNACIIDNKVICGKTNIHKSFKTDREIIEVNQGYAKCSVCVVDDNSLITDDVSIYKACKAYGFDVLLVSKGDVILDGFDYGFIGGCCGKISYDTLAFCGNLNTHSDASDIKSFLSHRSVYPLSLGSGNLTDIGSLLPIAQQTDNLIKKL